MTTELEHLTRQRDELLQAREESARMIAKLREQLSAAQAELDETIGWKDEYMLERDGILQNGDSVEFCTIGMGGREKP